MVSRFIPRVVVLALVVLGPPATPAVADMPAIVVHDGPSAPAEAWRRAMEAGDLDTLARMHDAATTAFPPGGATVTGAAAIMKGYAETFATSTVRVSYSDTHWVRNGNLVVSWGLSTLTFHPKAGGTDVVARNRFTDAAVKTESGWRYLVDHASASTRP